MDALFTLQIALQHAKSGSDVCHCYLQQILWASLGKWYLQVYYIYQNTVPRLAAEKAPHSVKDKIVLSVPIKRFDENNLQCKSAKGS